MLIILLLFFLLFAPPALATNCANVPIGGNYTVSTACAFPGTSDGVDSGSGSTNNAVLTVTTGGTLTIGAGQTFTTGSISLTGGSIAIISTGVIKIGAPLYITNADGDGYPANTTQYTSAAAGRVRRNTLASFAIDCNDAASTQYQDRTCYYDGDNDGYRTAASATRCVGADCTNSSDAYKRESTAPIDCNDANAALTTVCCTDTYICDTCYDTCCATCCTEHSLCGQTCPACASGPFSGCSNYYVYGTNCYCQYCQINYSCNPCVQCNPYSCNCRWVCI